MPEDIQKEEENPQETKQDIKITGKKKIIIYTAVIVAQLIAAIFLVQFLLLPMFTEKADSAEAGKNVKSETATKELGPTYTLEILTVNPKNSMGRRFGIFEIVLESFDREKLDKIKQYEPLLRDKYIGYFSLKTIEELSLPSVRENSKTDLMNVANQVLGEKIVRDVYYNKYVLQ